MRQIIWTLGSGQESLNDLVAYLRNHAVKYLDEHGIACAVSVDGDPPSIMLPADVRRELLLIMKEALHNVVKHALATHVALRIEWSDGLSITLHDNGRGFDAVVPDPLGGHGLASMRRRVEGLGGVFTLTNKSGTTLHCAFNGTTVSAWSERTIAAPRS